ncbi:MAG: DEAD/DEAH box helicase [Selenomonadaceae bacterium]|nr:DEAD/DEAH box helicase [Selenomonadaceae bacterium]
MRKDNDLDIKNFNDIHKKHNISKDTLDAVVKRLAKSMGILPEDVKFTALQREAFNKPGFWLADNDSRHIVLQGATSAGKTLVSEMSMLDTLKSGNKTIVLVPLRAMVRERWEHWKKDLEYQGDEKRVYASSSDYQDHDSEIIDGKYDVAVIVYEKFFTMLTQSEGAMLDGCGLLIVDEMQMLNNQNRGPKLEIAIQKVLRKNTKGGLSVRIMCLTTCDCKVEYVKRWFTVNKNSDAPLEPILIRNEKRPTALDEYVIQTNGNYRMKHNGGENEEQIVDAEPQEGKIEIPAYNEKARPEEKKKLLLKTLLQKIYAENPNSRVLVFVNGRPKTVYLAKYISDENIFPDIPLSENLLKIDTFDNDEHQKSLRNLLIKRIGCHSAAMTTALREFVEERFEDPSDPLKLVTATETLTVGMNMPVDVMILYDHSIPRGGKDGNELMPITSQEYKNYIGRAGRLGNKNFQIGKSYLIVESSGELRKLWNDYVDCKIDEIRSAFINSPEEEQAPYYLSLIQKNGYNLNDFNELWEESFSKSCGGRKIKMDVVLRELEKAKLCYETETDDDEDEPRYKLTGFGEKMAPYAFNLKTCKKINRYFFHGGKKRVKGVCKSTLDKGRGGLPTNISSEIINKYILDILYIICCTDEVNKIGQVKMPKDNLKSREAKVIVDDTLKRMVKELDFWEESHLKEMASDEYIWKDESDEKEPVMRAIILWHWINGASIEEIRNKTSFHKFTSLVGGDIARLAETVSYIFESFANCLSGYSGDNKKVGLNFDNANIPKLQSDIYKLAAQINYGVPQDLLTIAKQGKNVHALDRQVILKFGKFYDEIEHFYDNNLELIRNPKPEHKQRLDKIIDEEKRKELLKNVDESHTHETLAALFDNIAKESDIDINSCDNLKTFCNNDSDSGTENLLNPLGEIFKDFNDADNSKEYFFGDAIKIEFPFRNKNFAKLFITNKNIFLLAYTPDIGDKIEEYAYQISRFPDAVTILLINNKEKAGKINRTDDGTLTLSDKSGNVIFEKIHLAMSFENFGGLIAQTIVDGNKSASRLIELLCDWRGEFNKPLKAFPLLLKNYEQDADEHKLSDSNLLRPIRVLWDKHSYKFAIADLKGELAKQKIPYRELAWGKNLFDEREFHNNESTLLMLNWETVKSSESLRHFCEGLKKIEFKNVFAIFSSEENFKAWGGDFEYPCEQLQHLNSTKNFAKDIFRIKNFFDAVQNKKFRIGISYAHEKDFDAERPAVKLLESFVEKLTQAGISKELILFDKFHSYLFSGNDARQAVLEKYSQCEYFIILDDKFYDLSEFCREECATIQKKSPCRVWFLHPKNNKHCKFFNPCKDFLKDFSDEKDIDLIAEDFIKIFSDN